jgi:hypothetical protein
MRHRAGCLDLVFGECLVMAACQEAIDHLLEIGERMLGLNAWRVVGGVFMTAGIALVSWF